jgi:hypothetical protein
LADEEIMKTEDATHPPIGPAADRRMKKRAFINPIYDFLEISFGGGRPVRGMRKRGIYGILGKSDLRISAESEDEGVAKRPRLAPVGRRRSGRRVEYAVACDHRRPMGR